MDIVMSTITNVTTAEQLLATNLQQCELLGGAVARFQRTLKIGHCRRVPHAAFTIIEMLIVLIIVGLAIGLFVPAMMRPPQPPPPKTDADLDFNSWDSQGESRVRPPADIVVKDVAIAGEWFGRGTYVSLGIEKAPAEKWTVRFRSGTRCGLGPSILLTRTATYKDGVLLLDRPVQTLAGETFQRVYKVRIRGKEYLVPSANVKALREVLNGTDSHCDPEWKFLAQYKQQEP
jgi:prepilin-type N-terminal cleavage/methylation domain-containing protein